MSATRYSMGNRDLVLVLDDNPRRCHGLNSRYAVRCSRTHGDHPTGLCALHRDQGYCCVACKQGPSCDTHPEQGDEQ